MLHEEEKLPVSRVCRRCGSNGSMGSDPIEAEALDALKKAMDNAQVGMELPCRYVFILHGEHETPGGIVCFLVDYQGAEKGLRPLLRVSAHYGAVVERVLFDSRRYIRHCSYSLFRPLRNGRLGSDGHLPISSLARMPRPRKTSILYQISDKSININRSENCASAGLKSLKCEFRRLWKRSEEGNENCKMMCLPFSCKRFANLKCGYYWCAFEGFGGSCGLVEIMV